MKESEAMKKWLIPVVILVLAIAGTTAGVFAVTDEGDGEPAAGGAPRSDEGIDPNQCNFIHNINACDADDVDPLGRDPAALVDVTVNFNESVTQHDLDEVVAFLREFDADLEFAFLESFPPILSATLTAEIDVCSPIEADLGAETYVLAVSCDEFEVIDVGDADQPVLQPAD